MCKSARVAETSSQAFVCVFARVRALKRAHVFVWWSAMSWGACLFPFCKENQSRAEHTQILSSIRTRHIGSAVILTRNALAHMVACSSRTEACDRETAVAMGMACNNSMGGCSSSGGAATGSLPPRHDSKMKFSVVNTCVVLGAYRTNTLLTTMRN